MDDYIKREDALSAVLVLIERQRIKEIPAADVVEARHGKWEQSGKKLLDRVGDEQ